MDQKHNLFPLSTPSNLKEITLFLKLFFKSPVRGKTHQNGCYHDRALKSFLKGILSAVFLLNKETLKANELFKACKTTS